LIILKIAKNINKKICLTLQGADIQIDNKIEYGYRLNKKYNDFFLKNLKNVDYFFSISKNIKEDLLKIGVNEKKIIDFPNTIVLKNFI
jgi:glycosyltransferase involved in cell wall biosynthesis